MVEVVATALANVYAQVDLPIPRKRVLERQAMALIGGLYSQGWTLRELLSPAEEKAPGDASR